MQDTSSVVNYDTIIAGNNYWYETRVLVNGVPYDETQLFSVSTSHEMFHGTPTIGGAVAGEIDVTMVYPSADVPPMASIQPQVRVKNDTLTSGWIPQGFYYIDTRERTINDHGESVLIIHGYDAMLKAEQMYNGRIAGDSTDIQMVTEIAYQMGVTLDPRTNALVTNGYTIPLPTGYTYREILGYIASMYVGCFIMSDEGKLRLVSILELPPETNYLVDNAGDAITFGGDRILV